MVLQTIALVALNLLIIARIAIAIRNKFKG